MGKRMDEIEQKLFGKIIDVCWTGRAIYRCWMGDRVMDAVRIMRDRDYTHVPIVDNDMRLLGLFSENTLLRLFANNKSGTIDEETTFYDINEFLARPCENNTLFTIVYPEMFVSECIDIFTDYANKEERLDIIFVTENGTINAPLIGLTTVWDLIGRKV